MLRRLLVVVLALVALSTTSCGFLIKNKIDIDEAPKAAFREDQLARTNARVAEEAERERRALAEASRRAEQREKLAEALQQTADLTPQEKEQTVAWCPDLRNFLYNGEKAVQAANTDDMKQWLVGMQPALARVAVYAPAPVRKPAEQLLPGVRDLANGAPEYQDMAAFRRAVSGFVEAEGDTLDDLFAEGSRVCAANEGINVVDARKGLRELLGEVGT